MITLLFELGSAPAGTHSDIEGWGRILMWKGCHKDWCQSHDVSHGNSYHWCECLWDNFVVFVCLFDFVEAHAKLEASMKDWVSQVGRHPAETWPSQDHRAVDKKKSCEGDGWELTQKRTKSLLSLEESGFQKFKDLTDLTDLTWCLDLKCQTDDQNWHWKAVKVEANATRAGSCAGWAGCLVPDPNGRHQPPKQRHGLTGSTA